MAHEDDVEKWLIMRCQDQGMNREDKMLIFDKGDKLLIEQYYYSIWDKIYWLFIAVKLNFINLFFTKRDYDNK